jgi:hypothetical protein
MLVDPEAVIFRISQKADESKDCQVGNPHNNQA